MLTTNIFKTCYPTLAQFSSNPDSLTYTRRSKTGKIVTVRKGKKKKMSNLAKGALVVGGLGVAIAAGVGAKKLLKRKAASGGTVKDLYNKEQKSLNKMKNSDWSKDIWTDAPPSDVSTQRKFDILMKGGGVLRI